MDSSYVVISPVKNEADLIGCTINSMIIQTVQPDQWIIVNDSSSDNTAAIVSGYCTSYPWITLVNRNGSNRNGSTTRKRGKGVVEVFYTGYETLTEPCDFIVKLDGDLSFGSTYFESLLKEFESDPKLGIAGGGLYEKPDNKKWRLMTTRDHVRGCTKVYRRACFEAINGLVPSMGWDGIDEWKALSLGWKVQSFLDIKIYHHRYTGAATGFLKSFYEQGFGAYRMGYHPLYLFARSIVHMNEPPYILGGMAMAWAYIIAGMRKEEILADKALVSYIHHSQLNKLAGFLTGKSIHEISSNTSNK